MVNERATHARCPSIEGEGPVQSCHHLPWGTYTWAQGQGQGTDWAVGPVHRVEEMGPAESPSLQGHVETLQGLLERVREQVAQRAQAWAHRSFLQESQRLLLWADSIQAKLRSKEEAVDVASAQQLLGKHRELLEEIHLQQERSGREGRWGMH